MNLTDELRETLHTNASEAPVGAGLLAGVRDRANRLQRRRAIGIAATCAVVTVAGIAMTPLLAGGNARPSVPDVPGASTSAVAEPAPYQLYDFPYEPSWVPDGFGERRLMATRAMAQVSYHDQVHIILARVVLDGHGFSAPGTDQQITVNGRPAVMRATPNENGGQNVSIRWEQDGRVLEVHGHARLSPADVIRFAEGLRPGRIEAHLPFVVRRPPSGFSGPVYSAADSIVCFQRDDANGQICVSLGPVRDKPSLLRPNEVSIKIDGNREIVVGTDIEEKVVSKDELRSVAQSVVVTG